MIPWTIVELFFGWQRQFKCPRRFFIMFQTWAPPWLSVSTFKQLPPCPELRRERSAGFVISSSFTSPFLLPRLHLLNIAFFLICIFTLFFPQSCLYILTFFLILGFEVCWELLWLMLLLDPFTGFMTWLSWRSWWRWEWNGLLVKNERKDTVPTPEECDANTPCSIQDGKDPEFWPESMSPFYTLPTGARSCYNHVVMAGLQVDQFNLVTIALLLLVVVSEFEFAINLFLICRLL